MSSNSRRRTRDTPGPGGTIWVSRTRKLRYTSDQKPGIQRRRNGSGFSYRSPSGRLLQSAKTLDRIRSLAIPPAWENVWISPDANGHLQATGRDARGRKQHLYHRDWARVRDEQKYERMLIFARRLPRIRRRVSRDLARRNLSRQKVLAAVVGLLDVTRMRVGNEEYARHNHSYGLTTLRDRHVRVRGKSLRLRFRGKGGKEHILAVSRPRLARTVKRCQDLPGQELFQYLDEQGDAHSVGSADVNEYLRRISGADITAKDFRTWAGTCLAAAALAQFEPPATASAAKRLIHQGVQCVAKSLGNTSAICRKCYIHPAVFKAFEQGRLCKGSARKLFRSHSGNKRRVERGVIGLLKAMGAAVARRGRKQ